MPDREAVDALVLSSGTCQVAPDATNDRPLGCRDLRRRVGQATNDAAQLLGEPGALLDNTTSYVFWALAAERSGYPTDHDRETLTPRQLRELALTMMTDWSPRLPTLVGASDPDTITPIPIRTSVPVAAWPTTTVTLIGDAIHAMTPFRGIGANTALRDASLLACSLTAADRDPARCWTACATTRPR
jgi:2-polyprenyl-6-methoxyphenol hydroxylase-like FAD-dependent oxidoreductase